MATIRKPFFVVPLTLNVLGAGNAQTSYPAFNIDRHNAIGLTWKTDGNSNVWVRGMFSEYSNVDFCAMISANAQAGTKIRLRLGDTQSDVDGGSAPYDSGVLDFISPSITREDGLYHSHIELDSVVSARWWRIDITGHTGDFQASDLVIGQKIEPSRYYDSDFQYDVRDLGDIQFSRFGVFDETPGAIFRTIDFTLAWQTEAEFEASFRPMIEKVGRRGIVFVCFDPEPTTYRQARTYMGVFDKTPYARGTKKARTFSQEYTVVSMI